MAKATTLQGNFSAGELSPLLKGRAEAPRYKQGLDTCLSYIPTLQGPLVRRPGFKFMNAVKDSTKPPVLVPFQFSITQAYTLEFGESYIRFYANNGQIVTTGSSYQMTGGTGPLGFCKFFATRATLSPNQYDTSYSGTPITPGSILELGSPYLAADLAGLKFCQSSNVMYITHPSYPTYKLQRFGQTYWELQQVYFQDGPYMALNSVASIGDSTAITVTLGTYLSHPGRLITGPQYTISSVSNNNGQIQITTSTANIYVNGEQVYITGTGTNADNTNIGGGNERWTISVIDSSNFVLVGSTYVSSGSGGSVMPAIFTAGNSGISGYSYAGGKAFAIYASGQRYWGYIIGSINAAVAVWQQDPTQFATTPLAQSTTGTAWQFGTYGLDNGFPACATFHQNRLALAGCANFPQEMDLSSTGTYENFAINDATTLQVADDNAIQYSLLAEQSNAIFWMKSTSQALLAGSYSSEWAITPNSTADALTPSSFNASQTSFFGSSNIDACLMGNAALYVQRGMRKIREINYFFQVGTFRSTDMTEISEHITNPGVTKLAVQRETQPLLWAIRSDGALLSMVYSRDDASIQAGWARHYLGGRSDASGTIPIVTSLAVIPAPDTTFDQVWVVVKRYINGATTYGIEYMTKIFDELSLQEDAFQGDCGGTYDAPIAIAGISNTNPAVVTTSSAHGLVTGKNVRFNAVVGVSQTTTDINGNTTTTSLLNYKNFTVTVIDTLNFSLQDYSGNNIDATQYSAWVSGGQVRQLITNITGLTWLANETISVLADGGPHPDVTVSAAGGVTLNFPAAKVQLGYSYKSQGKLLRVEGGSADGSSIGKIRRTTRAAFQLFRTGSIYIGTSFTRIIPMNFQRADNQTADNPLTLVTGMYRDGLESAYDYESQVCFQQSDMFPSSIISVTSFMEEQDV